MASFTATIIHAYKERGQNMALAGDHVQVLVGGYDLTTDHNKVMIDDAYKMLEAPAFGEGAIKTTRSHRLVKLQHQGYLNPATGQSHPVLNGADVNGVVAILVGQNAAPAVGDPVYSLLTQQESIQTTPQQGELLGFKANFAARSGAASGWGVALAVPVTFTNSTDGSSVDNGAASSNGGAAFLHILQAAATDTYSIIVEGSVTGAFAGEESTLGTFTLNASALGSERLALSGSIPRYTRFTATRTGSAGDTVKIAVSLVRF